MDNAEEKPAPIPKKKSEEKDVIDDYPEHCDTQKEKDCWKLFKKMLGNGVTVNYDTILRGMLTPTELRSVMGKRVELNQENEQNDQNESIPGWLILLVRVSLPKSSCYEWSLTTMHATQYNVGTDKALVN